MPIRAPRYTSESDGLGRHFNAFVGKGEVADDALMEGHKAGAVVPDVVRTQRWRNSSLRVESSPMRS